MSHWLCLGKGCLETHRVRSGHNWVGTKQLEEEPRTEDAARGRGRVQTHGKGARERQSTKPHGLSIGIKEVFVSKWEVTCSQRQQQRHNHELVFHWGQLGVTCVVRSSRGKTLTKKCFLLQSRKE